jgi:uncharacterized protein (TIGR02145 family)
MLTLSSFVAYGNIVTVAYTKPASNPLQTASGGQAANLATQAVTNNCMIPPTLTTSTVTSISLTTAVSGGDITSGGGGAITARGVCWATTSGPTISNNITTNGTGTGSYTSNLSGLVVGTTYYIRAYATNGAGTAYGNQLIFNTKIADVEGNTYNTVTIGTQIWMSENLKTIRFNDNTTITNVTDNTAWAGLTTPAYCWYNNDAATYKSTYGALYNWYAVDVLSNGGKNVCPSGWHVPSDTDWTTLTDYLINNGYGYQGSGTDIAKSLATQSGWMTFATAGTPGNDQVNNNSSGFTAFPSGYRDNLDFFGILITADWWSGTMYSGTDAFGQYINYNNDIMGKTHYNKKDGFSVRCLKD